MAALALPQLKSVANRPETLTAIAAVSIILMLIVPLPFWLLDGLIALNITIALGVLMLTFYVTKPLEFSSFPSMLLLFFGEPVLLIIVYAAMGALFLPFLAITLLWLLNSRRVAPEHRNGIVSNIILVASVLLFVFLGIQEVLGAA